MPVPMSAFVGKADIGWRCSDVRFVTKAQGPGGGGGGRGGRGGGGFGLEGWATLNANLRIWISTPSGRRRSPIVAHSLAPAGRDQ